MKRSTCAREGDTCLPARSDFACHDEEGLGQLVGVLTQGDLTFLHRFQKRALHLGGRAVDFIGQDKIGEDGPSFGLNVPSRGL